MFNFSPYSSTFRRLLVDQHCFAALLAGQECEAPLEVAAFRGQHFENGESNVIQLVFELEQRKSWDFVKFHNLSDERDVHAMTG